MYNTHYCAVAGEKKTSTKACSLMQPASRAANATKCLLLSSLQGKQNEAMGILAPWLLNTDPMQ